MRVLAWLPPKKIKQVYDSTHRVIWTIRGTMPPKPPSARYVQKPSPVGFPKKNVICMKVKHGKKIYIEIPWNICSRI